DSMEKVGPLPTQIAPEAAETPPVDHVLQQYPRGPLVPPHRVPASIKYAYAEFIRDREARQVINDANLFREEADPADSSVTIIKPFRLRSPVDNPLIDFWMDAFSEAGKHGPRMMAALLLVVGDAQFPESTKKDRQKFLAYLRQPTE